MRDRLAPESVDLIVTSPPYDKLRTYNGFCFDFEKVLLGMYKAIKPGGVVVWVVNDACVDGSRTGTSFKQALEFMQVGFNLLDTMIWQKPNYAPLYPSVKRYDQNYEFMFIFSLGTPKTFNPIKDKPKSQASIDRAKYPTSFIKPDGSRVRKPSTANDSLFCKRNQVWVIPNGQKRGLNHPAPFPEALVHDHVVTWSNPGDLVYDPFMGSGTTGVVCKGLGRCWVGSEVSSDYCSAAEQRILSVPEIK